MANQFAVIKTYGKQYKVAQGDVLKLPVRMQELKDKKITFSEVLLIDTNGEVKVGKPLIDNASVEGEVVDQGRDKKIIIFKYKSKKRYRLKKGHRQDFTRIKIAKINS